jgi:hypothetical protein
VYREQEYVERCHCNEPAVAPCNACGRARCALHLDKRLCNRCTQYIGRELDQRSTGRWIGASVTGVTSAFVAMVTGAALFAPVIGLPLGVATFFLSRVWQRASLVQKMGPALAASKGELPPAPDEPKFPDAPPPNPYTGL